MRDEWKKKAASKALTLKEIREADIVGVGTGSTINHFINQMDKEFIRNKYFVPSSWETTLKLRETGAKILHPTSISSLKVYVDGADAVDDNGNLVKGGGGALLREKILANMSDKFIVIIDEDKLTRDIKKHYVPLEVLPIALSFIKKRLKQLNLEPRIRRSVKGKWGIVTTDNCNAIIDVTLKNWKLGLEEFETTMKKIPGVIETGLFISLTDIVVVGGKEKTEVIRLR